MTPKARFLVVDHDAQARQALADAVRRAGHECEVTGDAKRAITALRAEPAFDGVLVNLAMPGNAAFDVLARGEAEELAPPVIAVTDEPAVATAVRALRMGAIDYLVKPPKAEELANALERAITRSRAMQGLRRAHRLIQLWARWVNYLGDVISGPGSSSLSAGMLSALAPGRGWFDPATLLSSVLESGKAEGLSPREREVLLALAGGRRLREIARDLRISVNTVRNHLRSLMRKVGAHSQSELIARVRQVAKGK